MKQTLQEVVQQVADALGTTKVMWPKACKLCKSAMASGFTLDDFLTAVKGMKAGDKKYWSIYSIFSKPDYWMQQAPKEEKKGVW